MGKELTFKLTGSTLERKETKSNGETQGVYEIPSKDIKKLYEDRGFPHDLLKKLNEVDDEVIAEGFKLANSQVLANKEQSLVKAAIPHGGLKAEMRVKPFSEDATISRITTPDGQVKLLRGEKVKHYGVCRLSVKRTIPATLRKSEGLMEQIEKECELAFKK